MNSTVLEFTKKQLRDDLPRLFPGQTVRVHQKIKEGDKERVQVFEGMIIAFKGATPVSRTITVRKVAYGVGVERIYPLNSPLLEKIEVIKSAQVRRAKLYYIRRKDVKMKEDKVRQEKAVEQQAAIDTRRKERAAAQAAREEAKKKFAEQKEEKAEEKKEPPKTEVK